MATKTQNIKRQGTDYWKEQSQTLISLSDKISKTTQVKKVSTTSKPHSKAGK